MSEETVADTTQPYFRKVRIGSLHLEHGGFVNPRTVTGLTEAEIAELVDSIKEHGIMIRPEVVKVKADVPAGYIDLVWDGQRRVISGTKALGRNAEIEVIDLYSEPVDLSDKKVIDELEDRALELGQKRAGLSSYELVQVAVRRRARGVQNKVIAKSLNKSESWVSRMLKAFDTATPKLVLAWQTGKVTDEQFKELAAERETAAQEKAADEVVDARAKGNKVEARTKAKEVAETAKQRKQREKAERIAKAKQEREERAAKKQAEADAKKAAAAAKKAKGAKGAKADNPPPAPAPPKAKPKDEETKDPKEPKLKPPSKVELAGMVDLAAQRPPTHEYVKGLLDGARYALGMMEPHEFHRPWHAYINRLGGSVVKKPATKGARAKTTKPAKERRSKATKARSRRTRTRK